MKTIKFLLIAILFIGAYSASAQWTDTGTSAYYTGGNVGIGTSTPGTLLNVYGATAGAILRVESPYSGTALREIGSIVLRNPTSGDRAYVGFRKNGTTYEFIQSVYDASTTTWRAFSYFNVATRKFEMQNGVADAEYNNTGNILFNNAGSIAVGTSTIPTGFKLAVNGKIICEELQVELNSSWPDYVFDEDYKLRSLSEVEKYIKENKHLPGIPSANEVIENGLSIGDMNVKLMEKVEELTLYVIQLQKEVDALKKQ